MSGIGIGTAGNRKPGFIRYPPSVKSEAFFNHEDGILQGHVRKRACEGHALNHGYQRPCVNPSIPMIMRYNAMT